MLVVSAYSRNAAMSPQIRQLQLYRYLFWLLIISLLGGLRETGSLLYRIALWDCFGARFTL